MGLKKQDLGRFEDPGESGLSEVAPPSVVAQGISEEFGLDRYTRAYRCLRIEGGEEAAVWRVEFSVPLGMLLLLLLDDDNTLAHSWRSSRTTSSVVQVFEI